MKNSRPTSRGRFGAFAFAIVVPATFIGLAQASESEGPQGSEILEAETRPVVLELGATAPLFSLPTLAGRPWSLAEQAGKAVILEWIDPDCPMVTRQHSPEGSLRLLQKRCEGRRDMAWIAINSSHPSAPQSKEDANRAARESFLIDYPIGLDSTGWVGRAYGAEKATYVVLIDPSGKVAYLGAPDDGRENQLLSQALAHVTQNEPFDGASMPATGCAIRYADGVKLGAALPPLTFRTMDGEILHPHQFLGAPLVIEWFNPLCPVVQAAHQTGGALADAPEAWTAAGARWMFVNSASIGHESTGDRTAKKLAEWGYDDLMVALDPDAKLMEAFGAKVTPHMFVIDGRGVLVYVGGHTEKTNRKMRPLDQLLQAHEEGKLKAMESVPAAFGCSIERE
ncbi:Redoxin [Planctomycetes bacterium Poly30]|uniref:Redoxin n=1 Tax=Saltatorellus ferox TaxID=2528018 RepID=A0A518EL22_9BACT|nr:Redoxin [Planctomycetes bacterium Poly30]